MSSDNNAPVADPPSALPRGTRLGEFEILRVIGIGGFGIVYLAFDHALEREVAVKEYMPSALAGRTATMHVSLRSQGDSDTFALGLKSFVNEARLLARFDHASLLKVHRFWEANGTAYMAMPVYRGRTLKDVRQQMTQPPTEAQLRQLLDPLLGALATLHEAGVYHRDIAPDNIVLESPTQPVLLDFGAARRVIGDRSQTLTAILKPAYAPIEQYAEVGAVKQGPWTDLYALGATLHFLLLGRPPSPATARAIHDEQPPLATQGLAGVSAPFLEIIDWMLAPRPADRPQSVAELRAVLDGRSALPVKRGATTASTPAPEPEFPQTTIVPRTVAPAAGDDDGTIVRPLAAAVMPPPAPVEPPPAPRPAPAPQPQPRPPAVEPVLAQPDEGPNRLPIYAALAVVAVGVAAYVLWPRTVTTAPVPAPEAAASAPVLTPPPAPVAVQPPPPAPEPAPAPAPVAATPAPAPVSPPPAVAETKPVAPRPVASAASPKPAAPAPAPAPTAQTTDPYATPRTSTPPKPAPAPAPAVAEAPPPPAPVAPPSPRESCGGRVLVALSLCMERECRKAELKQHPDCVKWRADLDKLANPTN